MLEQRRVWWEQFSAGKISSPGDAATIDDPIRFHFLYEMTCRTDADLAARAQDAIEAIVSQKIGDHASYDRCITEIDASSSELLQKDEPWFASVRAAFFQRRETDMVDQRRIDPETFQKIYIHETHQHILWGTYKVNTLFDTFRIDDEHALVDVDDERFTIGDRLKVGVVHPLELAEPDRKRWDTVFSDYQLRGFDQTERQIQHRYGPEVQAFQITLEGDPSIKRLGIDGWKGSDLGWTTALKRRYSWAGHLEIAKIEIYNARVTLQFDDLEAAGVKAIRSVNPVVLFEAIRSIQQAISHNQPELP